MQIIPLKFKSVFKIILNPRSDERGFFMRTYDSDILNKYITNMNWVQENHSFSTKKGTIRGLHFQFPPYSEAKLVRCIRGSILDVFVDLRKSSATFGKWEVIELSSENNQLVYIPRGFAHGFCTLTENCDVLYKVDNYYHPEAEGSIVWNDPTLNIQWPTGEPILSLKDAHAMTFNHFVENYQALDL